MWRMLQADEPDTFVLATNKTTTVREFVRSAFKAADIEIEFSGSGVDEIGVDVISGRTLVNINPEFFRPAEVELLLGDASKAKDILGWEPRTTVEELCRMMVESDLERQTRGSSH
jgi:GDPmannose 4,6-dehydratase